MNKRLESILSEMTKKVEAVEKKKLKPNLTHLQMEGKIWCEEMVKNEKLYFTKVDKGGSIIILDCVAVDRDKRKCLENSSKYEKLKKDPRPEIKEEIGRKVDEMVKQEVITPKDRMYVTGKTVKNGYCHDPAFQVREPYVYPLYKIHKLTSVQIAEKVIPPNRMVTSAVSGPTYRIGVLLYSILKPVAAKVS